MDRVGIASRARAWMQRRSMHAYYQQNVAKLEWATCAHRRGDMVRGPSSLAAAPHLQFGA